MNTDFDIVIVGGGAAGIGAARRLAAGRISTLLIEASDRVGGRARTERAAELSLDLGCGYLHSADRNAWAGIAEASGFAIDRRKLAWGVQCRDLGFLPQEQVSARQALEAWKKRLVQKPPATDCAADALAPSCEWNTYIQAMGGFISGARLEQVSAADFAAYETAATACNWRVPAGYGTLIAASLPPRVARQLSTPVQAISFEASGVLVETPAGSVRAKAAIITVSTSVLAGEAIRLPAALDAWRHAAALLPLGKNEKVFFQITGGGPFAPETQVLGNPRSVHTGAYYIRPLGWPVIECFLGGEGARMMAEDGLEAGFANACEELAGLFGSDVRRTVRPLVASGWSRNPHVGGAYSCALPGHAPAREVLARPFDDRLFFAGEATHRFDFSTAHGAHDSGVRAAEQAIASLAAIH
jgi:monoamine oxidase